MAILKEGQYSVDFQIETGDSELDSDMKEQLGVSKKELLSAINAENVTDSLFGRILKNRKTSHDRLVDKIPGAEGK